MFGFIYEIKSIDKSVTEIYIGSCWNMKNRYWCHKHRCNNKNRIDYNYPLYRYIRENGGFDNFEMTEIDSGECQDKTELECGEQFYIDLYGGIENLLNSQDAILNINKERENRKTYSKKTRQKAIDTKRFYCKTCDIATSSQRDLDRHLNSINHQSKYRAQNIGVNSPSFILGTLANLE